MKKGSHALRVVTSSSDMTWATPQQWYDYLNLEFKFTLDPCCAPETAKCARYFTPADNGLLQTWSDERVFMNPPYGTQIGEWMKKAREEARGGRWWSVWSRRESMPSGGTDMQCMRRTSVFQSDASSSAMRKVARLSLVPS